MNIRICIPYYREFDVAMESWRDKAAGVDGRVECMPRHGTHIAQLRNDLINDRSTTGSRTPLNYTHFLFHDSDVKANGSEALNHLLSHDVDIVGAKYKMHTSDHCYAWRGSMTLGLDETGFQEVDEVGTGFLLIKRHVFTTIKPPWFYMPAVDGDALSEDQAFCRLAKRHGFKIYLDADLELEHKHN